MLVHLLRALCKHLSDSSGGIACIPVLSSDRHTNAAHRPPARCGYAHQLKPPMAADVQVFVDSSFTGIQAKQ